MSESENGMLTQIFYLKAYKVSYKSLQRLTDNYLHNFVCFHFLTLLFDRFLYY